MLGAYVHIPFCVSKCHYCDFNSIGLGKNPVPERAYLQDLRRDIGSWREILENPSDKPFETVFFGGGTPSLFSPGAIGEILEALNGFVPLSPQVETTLELNPKTADLQKMRGFAASGIQRLSIGVQSLEEEVLRPLARAHSAKEALQALDWALVAGFPRVNIDLMYALPGQSLDHLSRSLEKLQDYPLTHVSAYELIWEEGTPFYEDLLRGRKSATDEELALQMQERLAAFCENKGLRGYEVSNYARVGEESRHNLSYWNYESFIGFGAGAVSFLRAGELSSQALRDFGIVGKPDIYGLRLSRPRPLPEYSRRAGERDGFEIEPISLETAMGEFMMMGLRKTAGVAFADFAGKFQRSAPDYFAEPIQRAERRGWMALEEGSCRLTPAGMKMSNEVLRDFVSHGRPC